MFVSDIDECWNSCACSGEERCENLEGSFVCNDPLLGMTYVKNLLNGKSETWAIHDCNVRVSNNK